MKLPFARFRLLAWEAVVFTFLLAQYPAGHAALSDGLVSHWPLDSDGGGIAADAVFDNDLVFAGAPVVVAGQVGNAYQFDGVESYLSITHPTDRAETGLPIYRAGSYTITMWVKGPAQTARYLFSEGSTANNNPLLILQTGQAAANNAKFDVIIRSDPGGGTPVNHVVSTNVLFDDTWHHIAWVDDNGNARLYIDGVQDPANFSYTPIGTFTMNTTAIGTLVRAAVSTGAIFNGLIDDVGLWERALSEDEVNQVRQNGVPVINQVAAPTIDSAPGDASKRVGDWVLFSVEASGTRPFTFQWLRNDTPISGATGQTLLLTNLTASQSGEAYSVIVSNAAGSVTTTNVVLTVTPDPEPNVREGLVNYWPLNEIQSEDGLLVSPDTYSGNDMVLVNFLDTSDVVPGQFGNALSFDFVTKYAYRTNGAPIYNHTNYSIALWVKAPFESQNDRRVFSEGSSTSDSPLFTLGTDNTAAGPSATVFVRNNSGAAAEVVGKKSVQPVFDDTWHHIVWTDANGVGKLYIDGQLDGTDYTYTRSALSLDQTSLGAVVRARVGNYYFGNIDEVATWRRVLSWTEIQEIMTNGIPAPVAAIPPVILTQPTSRTNEVFTGDLVIFTVQANGTEPLSIQWYRNGQPIVGASNPSAQTTTLVFSNAVPADSGELFVVLTNVAGAVTSSVVALSVSDYIPVTSGEVLAIDVGLNGASNLQPGFSEFNLGVNGRSYNGVKVTVSGTGTTLAERNRTTGAMAVNNPPALTYAQLYNDFIFANSTTDGTGLRILIERLAPNTPFDVRLWSFDPQSPGARFADWAEVSSGTPIPMVTGYTFDGSIPPTNDLEKSFSAVVTSSPSGTLELEGLKNGGTSFGVFVNGLRLIANPGAATLRITEAVLQPDKLRLTVQLQQEGQMISFEQRPDVASGTWVPATGGTIVSSQGNTAVTEFPTSDSRMFYRAVVGP